MRLYALSGRQAEALKQYEHLEVALFKELGTRPNASSRALREKISSDGFPPEGARDQGTPLEDPASLGRHNLPAPRTSFVGRQREVVEVKRALAMTRLLTLTGAGGCGKTRLALEVARDLVGAYPDGVWLVELAPLSEGELVPKTVAEAVGIPEMPGRQITEVLVQSMRSKEQLVVMDNCEHLIEPTALLVDTLLDSCPRLRILATSREPLEVAGELNRPVPSLSVPDGQRSTVEEMESYAGRWCPGTARCVERWTGVTSCSPGMRKSSSGGSRSSRGDGRWRQPRRWVREGVLRMMTSWIYSPGWWTSPWWSKSPEEWSTPQAARADQAVC
jgi:hypothetical protein